MIRIVMLLLLASCGGTYEVKLPEDPVRGESYNYVIVQLEFIQQMRDLCEDLHPVADFPSVTERQRTVAQCTLDNISILDVSAITNFNNEFCNGDIDTSTFTPEELAQLEQICGALNA